VWQAHPWRHFVPVNPLVISYPFLRLLFPPRGMIYESAAGESRARSSRARHISSSSVGDTKICEVSSPRTKSSRENESESCFRSPQSRFTREESNTRKLPIFPRQRGRLRAPLRAPEYQLVAAKTPPTFFQTAEGRPGDRADSGIFSRHGGGQGMRARVVSVIRRRRRRRRGRRIEVLPSSRAMVSGVGNSRFHASQFGESRRKNNTPPTSTGYREGMQRRILTVNAEHVGRPCREEYRVSSGGSSPPLSRRPDSGRAVVLLERQRGRYCSWPMTILVRRVLSRGDDTHRHLGSASRALLSGSRGDIRRRHQGSIDR